MAKTKRVSPLTGEVRGKVGTIIFSKNQYGEYQKTARKPTVSFTEWAEGIRQNRKRIIERWKTLTWEQKAGWRQQVETHDVKNQRGTGRISGYMYFISINTMLLKTGADMMTDAPQELKQADPLRTVSINIDRTPGMEDMTVSFSPALTEENYLEISMTPVMPKGIKPQIIDYRGLTVKDSSFKSGNSIKNEFIWRYNTGLQQAGTCVYAKLRKIENRTGQDSGWKYVTSN